MDIKIIQEFLLLSEIGNYDQAAKLLYISQTALTRHMLSLEEELGVKLFNRSKRSNSLTNAGMLFIERAEKIVLEANSAKSDLHLETRKFRGYVAIAVPFNCKYYGILDLIAAFHKVHPDIDITVTEDSATRINHLVSSKIVPFGFITETGNPPKYGLEKVVFLTDTMALCLPSNHPLCSEKRISPEMLRNEKFAMPANKGPIYTSFIRACISVGFEPDIAFTVSATNIYHMVKNGLCIGFLPKKPAMANHPEGTVIKDLSIPSTTYVCMLSNTEKLNSSEQLFYDFAHEYIKNHFKQNTIIKEMPPLTHPKGNKND